MQAGNTASTMLLLGVPRSSAPENPKIATPPTRKPRFTPPMCSKHHAYGHVLVPPTLPCRNFGFPGGGPKIAQVATQTRFLGLHFLVQISSPRRDPKNPRFAPPGGGLRSARGYFFGLIFVVFWGLGGVGSRDVFSTRFLNVFSSFFALLWLLP